MSEPLLAVEGLSVRYGRVEAVRDVSLQVHLGQIVSVIGANGAGKTTMLNAIMGVLPSTGRIRFDGHAIERWPIEDRVAAGVSLVPERRELFASMCVEDNLLLGCFRMPSVKRVEALGRVFDRFPQLRERSPQIAGTLSGGERQMLAMARALIAGPRLLMLDEPSLGLAPKIVEDILAIIKGLRETGVSTLLIEQNARAALRMSDYAYVMELGRFTLEGVAHELEKDQRVVDSYLGLQR